MGQTQDWHALLIILADHASQRREFPYWQCSRRVAAIHQFRSARDKVRMYTTCPIRRRLHPCSRAGDATSAAVSLRRTVGRRPGSRLTVRAVPPSTPSNISIVNLMKGRSKLAARELMHRYRRESRREWTHVIVTHRTFILVQYRSLNV